MIIKLTTSNILVVKYIRFIINSPCSQVIAVKEPKILFVETCYNRVREIKKD